MKLAILTSLLITGSVVAQTTTGSQVSLPLVSLPLVRLPLIALPTMIYEGQLVPAMPMQTVLIPLVVLRTQSVRLQALSVNLLLDKWIKLDSLLDTPAIYAGNHFAVEAAAIRHEAEEEGVTDAVLAKCADFATRLHQAEAGQ